MSSFIIHPLSDIQTQHIGAGSVVIHDVPAKIVLIQQLNKKTSGR
jgi:serine acetyltransferase